MSKLVNNGGFIVVFDNGTCSDVLDNVKDIQEFVEDNQDGWDENEITIYRLAPCEYTVERKLVIKERK